jgi:hypothetical protein
MRIAEPDDSHPRVVKILKRKSRKRVTDQDGTLRPRKYSELASGGEQRDNAFSASEGRLLARLIGKYGREAVLAAVNASSPPRPRGRPTRGNLPIYENMYLADWFEEAAEEYRQRGSKHPIRDAEIALHEMSFGLAPDLASNSFEGWRLNVKKKRLAGSRALKEVRKAAEARNRWLKGPK